MPISGIAAVKVAHQMNTVFRLTRNYPNRRPGTPYRHPGCTGLYENPHETRYFLPQCLCTGSIPPRL